MTITAGRSLSRRSAEGFSVALGIVLARNGGELEILTPLVDLGEVTGVWVGDLILDAETGEELSM
jgi:polynucleotide 5'-kinase involved in rRNA processing